jgi:hypothetical protein
MTNTHEVISAFLDDEPFNPRELADALSEPSGRALLIDMVALRHIVQPDDAIPAGLPASRTRRSPLRGFMAAAAVFVALVGGYFVGERRAAPAVAEAPAPTRVVQPATTWQEAPSRGVR